MAHREFVGEIAKLLRVPAEQIERRVDRYNSDFSAYGNEVYEEIETRVAHWVNFMEGGWFQRRLDMPIRIAPHFDVVVDIGFSSPYYYMQPGLAACKRPKFVFVDKHDSAVTFYDALVEFYQLGETRKRDIVVKADIELPSDTAKVAKAVCGLHPTSLLVVASEVLEHLTHDEPFWTMVENFKMAEGEASKRVYVTLPIGRKIPSHMMEFRTPEAAKKYAAERMNIIEEAVFAPLSEELSSPFLEACYCALGSPR
ncbi:hypothetical protein [Opitutus terrae]|uniref:Methyltransferase type 11 n=1 Tax=Opitutus terrae (strain DSM 11246 / JCM 15787 / PB90-1) TaxID=452637 RepID=B1ZNN0_OPITP|nr:hypothetical protein [Opitutus terrae]ACB74467.1 hypothetical protein Oter_1180 [Opitutus terrae PB90-1]